MEVPNWVNKKAIEKWGFTSQLLKHIEESSELNQKLIKYIMYHNDITDWKGKSTEKLISDVESEIADVIITLSSLIIGFDTENIKKNVTLKLRRLIWRLLDDEVKQ